MEKIPLERFEWPLALAIVCLVMEFLLPNFPRSRKAAALPSASARRQLRPVASAPGPTGSRHYARVMSQDGSAQTTDARILYNKGTAEYTAGELSKPVRKPWAKPCRPRISPCKTGPTIIWKRPLPYGQESQEKAPKETIDDWEKSLKAYSDALELDSSDTDARFNHDLVKRKLDELKKQNPDQQKDGEKKDGEEKDEDKKEGDKQDGERKMVTRKMARRTENRRRKERRRKVSQAGTKRRRTWKAKKDQPGKKTRKVRRKARGKVKAGKKRTVTKSRPRKNPAARSAAS